jgi:hypothetical protein
MIPTELLDQWQAGLADGSLVPYLGPGVLADVRDLASGGAMPATSDQLILAMNNGQPMAPKLMYEFPRAAMNIELKRGRSAVTRFLDTTYGTKKWTRAALHDWLAEIYPPYVIDINRDTQLQDSHAHMPHLLILGCAIDPAQADPALPVLFKPMGSPAPKSSYIASDADYVDYITELMGGFAVPSFVKARRKGKRYLLLGMRLNRDSERMVFSDLIYDAAREPAGWALIAEPTDKERRFCANQGIVIVEATVSDLLQEWSADLVPG